MPHRKTGSSGSFGDGDVLLIGQTALLEVLFGKYRVEAVELRVESETLLTRSALQAWSKGGIVRALRAGSHRLRR